MTPIFVDWIKFDGASWIDTGVAWASDIRIESYHVILDDSPTSGIAYSLDTPGVTGALHIGHVVGNRPLGGIGPLAVLGIWQASYLQGWGNYTDINRFVFDIKNKICRVFYGEDYSETTSHTINSNYYSQFRADRNVLIAANLSNTTGEIIYKGVVKFCNTFAIYKNESLVINLRPCLYNGQYGLWDTFSDTFYGNSGTGTITGGYD